MQDFNKISNTIKEFSRAVGFHKEHDFQQYYVESNPVIQYSASDVFELNEPVTPKIKSLSIYCDRVRINPLISHKNLKEVIESMHKNFYSHEFLEKVDITDYSFQVPGPRNEYCRLCENGDIEIRLFAQGFLK